MNDPWEEYFVDKYPPADLPAFKAWVISIPLSLFAASVSLFATAMMMMVR